MASIKLREIEIFLSVAKNQNISKAAKELYISQPAISNWISNMEDSYGVQLFQRTNRGAILTPEGERLYAQLDIAYNRFRVSVEEIFENRAKAAKQLRIGCLNRLDILKSFEQLTEEFKLHGDGAAISSERYNFHELRDRLLCGELDLAITLSTDLEPYGEFESVELGEFPLYFVTPTSFGGDLSELSKHTLFVENPTVRKWAEQICAAFGIIPESVRYVNSFMFLSTLVARGEGFAVDGRFMTEDKYAPDMNCIPINLPHDVKIVLAWAKDSLSPTAEAFVEFCRERETK